MSEENRALEKLKGRLQERDRLEQELEALNEVAGQISRDQLESDLIKWFFTILAILGFIGLSLIAAALAF